MCSTRRNWSSTSTRRARLAARRATGARWRSRWRARDLAALRALADGTRLRIVAILRESELYAQEVVARLGISQSAVSRHLSMLESAGIVRVRPANGMKYYAVNAARLKQLAESLGRLAE